MLKNLVILWTIFFAQQSLACFGNICVNDNVYTSSLYYEHQVGRVISAHPSTGIFVDYYGTISKVDPSELYVTTGCLKDICVGDVVGRERSAGFRCRTIAVGAQQDKIICVPFHDRNSRSTPIYYEKVEGLKVWVRKVG